MPARFSVTLVSVTDSIDSSTAAGRMMIGVLGSLSEYERELTKERTALKRATSRANGTKFGRRRKGRRCRPHRNCEADEGRRSHRQGYRQVSRGEQSDAVPVYGRSGCLSQLVRALRSRLRLAGLWSAVNHEAMCESAREHLRYWICSDHVGAEELMHFHMNRAALLWSKSSTAR